MENNGNNKFLNGFIWGAIIGGGLVFLLNTKKGKRLLKLISEEGLDGISNLIGGDNEEEFDGEDEGDSLRENGEVAKESSPTTNGHKPLIKRFFKGIPKRF